MQQFEGIKLFWDVLVYERDQLQHSSVISASAHGLPRFIVYIQRAFRTLPRSTGAKLLVCWIVPLVTPQRPLLPHPLRAL